MAQHMNAPAADPKPKPKTSSRVSSALKSGVVYGSSAVLTAVSNITPHIAGAVDILVVEQPDGSRRSSPFYVRFGKYTALRTGERNVKLCVNGKPAPFGMHIGMYGQAYFATAEAAEGDEDEQEALLAGVMSPPSGYSSGAEGETAETGETLTAVRRRINGIKAERAGGRVTGGNGARGRRAAAGAREDRESSPSVGSSPRVPVPALGTETAQRLCAAALTAGAIAKRACPSVPQAGEITQALQAKLAPALSANDRNESFLSAHETLGAPLGEDIIAAAVAAGASPSLLASPDIDSRQPPPLSQPPPQQQQQQQPKPPASRGGLQPAGGSTDSLVAESEGASPCGWSEDDEEEEGAEPELSSGVSPSCYEAVEAGAAVAAPRGGVPHAVSPLDTVAAGPAAEPPPLPLYHHGTAGQLYAVQAPLHLQYGFPEYCGGAASELGGSVSLGRDSARPAAATAAWGAAAATGLDLGSAALAPPEPGPRLSGAVDWAVLGAAPSPHAASAIGFVATPAMQIAAAAGRPAAPHSSRHRASPAAGGGLAAAAATDGTTHGSGSFHAVSLLSSSLKNNGGTSGGGGNGAAGAFGSSAALLGLAASASTDANEGPFAAAEAWRTAATAASGSARGHNKASGEPQRLIALSLHAVDDGGGRVRARLHVLPQPQPVAATVGVRCAGAASPFSATIGGTGAAALAMDALVAVPSCASEAGYLGDTEPSAPAADGRQHPHPHPHSSHHPIVHHHSHHVQLAHVHSHVHHHGHHHDHLHSTSAPLPSSAIDAAAAAAAAATSSGRSTTVGVAAPSPAAAPVPGLQLSLCGNQLTPQMSYTEAAALFNVSRVTEGAFVAHGPSLLASPELVVRLSNGAIYPWHVLSHSLIGLLAFGTWRVPPGAVCWVPDGAAPCDAASAAALLAAAAQGAGAAAAGAAAREGRGGEAEGLPGGSATTTPKKGAAGSVGSWLWPFGGRRDRSSATGIAGGAAAAAGAGGSGGRAGAVSGGRSPPVSSPVAERQASLERPGKGGAAPVAAAAPVVPRRQSSGVVQPEAAGDGTAGGPMATAAAAGGEVRRQGSASFPVTKKSLTPTPEQLAALDLKHGQNTITYRIGGSELKAYVYLLHWRTKIVISDIDGTITKSDVLGHLLPAMGLDWSHPGIAELLTNIRSNNYQIMYLSSRSISQANITRDFINTLVQGQHRMPLGPVIISPHGLLPSLYREMILRRPHDFKIETLLDIRALFPPFWNPFYGGFGNRDTDEISYREVGVQPTHIFIINPRGELRQPVARDDESDDTLDASRGGVADIESGLEPSGGSVSAPAAAAPGGGGGGSSSSQGAGPRPSGAVRVSSVTAGGRSRNGAAPRDTPLSSLSAINQLVHDIFPPLPLPDVGFLSSSSSSLESSSATAPGVPSGAPSVSSAGEAAAEAEAEAANGLNAVQREGAAEGSAEVEADLEEGAAANTKHGAGREEGSDSCGRSAGRGGSGGDGVGTEMAPDRDPQGHAEHGLASAVQDCAAATDASPPAAATPQAAGSPRGGGAGAEWAVFEQVHDPGEPAHVRAVAEGSSAVGLSSCSAGAGTNGAELATGLAAVSVLEDVPATVAVSQSA